MAVIFAKTRKGHAEIETRAGGLNPRVRRVLIFVDGKRPVEELRGMLQSDDLQHTLGMLEEEGFIEMTGVAGPGPDGDKPAGLVYVGLRIPASLTPDHAEVLKAVELHLDGMREEIRRLTVFHVLQNLSLFTASFKE